MCGLPVGASSPIVGTRDNVPPYGRIQREDNCACSADGFSLVGSGPSTEDAVPYTLPVLHTDTPAAGSHLAFNPLGEAGVVVLNEPAFRLLNVFRQPHILSDGVQAAGDPPDGLTVARRLVQLSLLDPLGGRRAPRRSVPQTLTAWLHVTNECNLRCPYCYVRKTPDDMTPDLGRQAVEAVFRSALANGFRRIKIKYAGGEATLNFHTVLTLHNHAQRLADEHGLTLEGVVLSNGVAVTDRMIDAMRALGMHLMISLDGVGAWHDAQRYFVNGRGSFAHVERALDRLAGRDFKPSISITISDRNLDGLPDVVAYVLQRDLPFTLNFYRENDCSASMADLRYGEERLIRSMQAAFAVIKANLPPYSLLGALVDRARLDAPHERPCGVGHNYLVINHRGGVAKCQMEVERAITDIAVADPLRVIREDQIGIQNVSVEEKEGCRECTWRYWCAGGCPALTYRATGRFDVKSPNCRIYKALFPLVLKLEALRLIKYSSIPR